MSVCPCPLRLNVPYEIVLYFNSSGENAIPWITAVGFGTPPCVDEAIADAMIEDNLMVSVVHCDDVVPRLSRCNIQALAIEVNKYTTEAAKFQKEDQKSLEAYAKNYGKTSDMSDVAKNSTDSATTEESSEDLKITELEIPFVVPGKIVHLTFSNGESMKIYCTKSNESL